MMLVPAGYTTDPLLEYLRELPGLGGMSPPQRAFHESWDRKRFVFHHNWRHPDHC